MAHGSDRREGELTTPDGVRLFYRTANEQFGAGQLPIVVPNGITMWDDLAPIVGRRPLVGYDLRNRGKSEIVTDPAKLARGVESDADDLDVVRAHFGFEQVDTIGHSYVGMVVALHAMRYPARVRRMVMLGPVQPDAAVTYPPELSNNDAVLAETMAKVGAVMKAHAGGDPIAACHAMWRVLPRIFVVNADDADKITWERCDDAPAELGFMAYWMTHVVPSLRRLTLGPDDFARVTAPVLVVHGRQDRSAPYGGGRDWAERLPDARLVSVDGAAHAPWIEQPALVYGAIREFLAEESR